jgi:hypothetical protein
MSTTFYRAEPAPFSPAVTPQPPLDGRVIAACSGRRTG